MHREAGSEGPDCEECPLVARREFLRNAGVSAAGILVALGALPSAVKASPLSFIAPTHSRGEEKSYSLPAADGTQIDKSNGTIITRWQGKLYVYSLACPHQNTALRWYDKDNRFECPKHHSRFEPDGQYVKDSGRATRGLDRFAVRRDGGNVVVNLDRMYKQDDDAADWAAAFITL